MPRQVLRGWLVAVAVVAAVLALPAAPALAHVSLTAAEPAEGATVTDAPSAVTLTFDGPLTPGGDHAVGLFAPDGAQVDDGQTVEESDRGVQVGAGALPDTGTYTVRWLVVGADGHNIEGDYTFVYDGPVVTVGTPPEPTPESGAAPSAAPSDDATDDDGSVGEATEEPEAATEDPEASPSPEADPTEVTATPEPAEPDGGAGVLVPAAVGVAAVLGAGALFLRRRGGTA